MFDELTQMISSLVSLSSNELRLFQNAMKYREVPKNFTLISEGQVSKELYFIKKGLLRLYYNKDGNLITAYIYREHLFASSYESFLQATPSIQYLETLEDCELLVLSKDNLEKLYQTIPNKMNILTRKVVEQRFINAQQILSSFIMESPEERYKKFAEKNGDLLLRIPHNIMASYLGITPVSLSRIRKRIIKKEM